MSRATFSVEARKLASVLTKLLPVVERRNTVPVLGCVRITPDADGVEVIGTDLDLMVTLRCAAERSGSPKAFCIDPRPLAKLLREIGSDRVNFDLVGMDINLTWPGGKARLSTLAAEDFPIMVPQGDATEAQLQPEFVTDVLMRVQAAVSREETRYYLNGVCLDGVGEGTAIATDGHRLMTQPAGEGVKTALDGRSIIVPRGFVERWIVLARGDEATISASASHLRVTTTGVEIVGKLIDGTFPDWRRVVPKDTKRVFEANRALLQLALRKLDAIQMERSHIVNLMPAETLIMQARAGFDGGAMELTVEGGVAALEEARGFNLRYLREAVDATRGATVRLEQATAADPALVVGSEDRPGAYSVVMPVRVSGTDAFAAPAPQRRAA